MNNGVIRENNNVIRKMCVTLVGTLIILLCLIGYLSSDNYSNSTIDAIGNEVSKIDFSKLSGKVGETISITEVYTIMYSTTEANVRSGPSTADGIIGSLSPNSEVTVTGITDNGWYRIAVNGGEGYVKGSLLSDSNTASSSASAAQGELVWVPTNGGTKYHSKSNCSKMKNPIQVTVDQAVANGFTACKRCH